MTLHQYQLNSGFVLHTRPYRETSVLVDFFTQESGRITAIVRGVRKARSSYAGLLLPFLPLCVSFRGKTELLNITTLESTGTYYSLQNQALFCGLYVNELLYHLLHKHDPYPDLFTNYQELLLRLQDFSSNATQQRWALCLFLKKLLQEIGYGVQWNRTVNGDFVNENASYFFEFGLGFSIAGRQQNPLKRYDCFEGRSLLILHNENYADAYKENISFTENLKEIGYIFNAIFHHLLGDKFLLCQRVFGMSNF